MIVPAVATVAPPSMKKSPSTVQMKLLPTGGGGGGGGTKTPPKPMMALPKASVSVKGETEKEQIMKESVPIKTDNDNNGGAGSGGAVDVASKEESNKNIILPSQEDLKAFVDAWLARPENAQVLSTLLPSAKEKEEIMKGCGVDKKRLEGYFYRMRKKLKQ